MRLTIASRLTVVIVLLAVALVGEMLIVSYRTATLALENNAKSQVQFAAQDKTNEIEAFFQGGVTDLQSLAGNSSLVNTLISLRDGPVQSAAGAKAALQTQLAAHATHAQPGGGSYLLLNQAGDLLASTGATQPSGSYQSSPFFQNGLENPYVQIPTGAKGSPNTIIIAAPVRDQQGRSLGVIARQVDLSALQAAVDSLSVGGQTGDQYLLNGERYFISQPRLRTDNVVLQSQDSGRAGSLCKTSQGMNVLTGLDYRGLPAVIAYRWLPDYGICVISKMDRAEVIAPIQSLRDALLAAGFIALIGAVGAAAILARSVTEPLSDLKRGVEGFGRGEYTKRITVTSGDEVGDLARAFNTMAEAIARQEELLRESNRGLEDKVLQRTAALQASEAELLVLFSAMQDLVLIYDREGRYKQSVPTGNQRLGQLLRHMEGKNLQDILPAGLTGQALKHIRNALAGQVVTDFEYELRVGTRKFHFIASISALTNSRVIWVARDVTARHATQQALLRSEALNRAVTENSPIGISIRDHRARLVYANEAWCIMRGFANMQEAVASSRADRRPPLEVLEYLGENTAQVARIYEEGGSIFIPEIEMRESRPGTARWVSQYFYGIRSQDGRVESVVTLTQDITARKESEQEVAAILDFSAAMRKPISRAETETAILEEAEALFSAEGIGLVIRKPGDPSIMTGAGRGAWRDWDSIQSSAESGLISQILSSKEIIVFEDVDEDQHVITTHLAGMKSLAAAPLVTHAQVIGALVIGNQRPLPETKLQLLRAVGEMAASALYRATLIEETERRLEWLLATRSIDRAIMGNLDLRITMNIVLEKAVTQLKMDAASILLLKGTHLEYAYGRGFKLPHITKTSMSLGQLQAGKAALENKPIFVGSYDPQEWDCELLNVEGFKSYCVVPLISQGQVQGVLEVYAYRAIEQNNEWMDFLISLAGLAALSLETARLFETVQRSNLELSVAYDITLEGWSRSIDMRYDKRPGHTQRVVDLTLELAQALGVRSEELVHIRRGAFLHDIGTVMVPEEILLKPSKLTLQEAQILHQYPAYSFEMLNTIEFLRPALDIPYCHREKWDGSGFPRGLMGNQIPFAARIFAVVEAWDSLTHDRPFRRAWTRAKALTYIREQAGKQFDPEVVRVFLEIIDPGGERLHATADPAS